MTLLITHLLSPLGLQAGGVVVVVVVVVVVAAHPPYQPPLLPALLRARSFYSVFTVRSSCHTTSSFLKIHSATLIFGFGFGAGGEGGWGGGGGG